ncbi:MAG: hypothetical protein ACFNUL_09465, partial [Cardiobacterium hominis]
SAVNSGADFHGRACSPPFVGLGISAETEISWIKKMRGAQDCINAGIRPHGEALVVAFRVGVFRFTYT